MELRAKSEPKEFSEKSVSAHQYSPKNISIQADSDEREENATMVNAIDLKTKMQNKINIYDLSVPLGKKAPDLHDQCLLKETKDVGIVTEFHRRLYCTQDWFYSVLYRDLIKQFYAKTGEEVPEGILKRWNTHDLNNNYMFLDDRLEVNNDTNASEDGNP